MIRLSRQWATLCLTAVDALQATSPRPRYARRPNSNRSIVRKAARKAGLGVGFAIALGTLGVSSSALAAGQDQTPEEKLSSVVETKEGPVQGFISNGVTKFLGIPYAEPPMGELRWLPPKDHARWTNVLPATKFAPICALKTTLGVFSGPPNNNEDCLYLNVFAPEVRPSQPLPVIVFIHGGGNYDGETPGYDGSKMVTKGKAIVVTMAYRLNLMGFLSHPALNNEGHPFANYGLLDQIAAFKWVQRNVSLFGGDKDNVTLAGQSAGAIDVQFHMVSPFAKDLFHRAICQSSCMAFPPLTTAAAAEAKGIAFAEAAGCGSGRGPEVAQCLRHLPAEKVMEFAGTPNSISQYVSPYIVDGQIVPDTPLKLFKNGQFQRVPVMNGGTRDEWNFTLALPVYASSTDNAKRTAPTAEQYHKYINSTFAPPAYTEGTAAKVLDLYPLSAFKSPYAAWNRVASDALRLCNLRSKNKIMAQYVPVYAYEFADATAPSYFPDMPGMEDLGAYHTMDIQYIFPSWHGSPLGIVKALNEKQAKLSDQMVVSWGNFAKTGNPNGTGNSPWPVSNANASGWLIQDLPGVSSMTDAEYSKLHNCDFWDSVGPAP